jgi:threonine dehydrogenase-like Zn-dependent dehydrogenase
MFHTWEESERLLSEKLVDIEPAITHEYPMTEFENAFATLFSGLGCKILMNPQQ